MGQSELSTYDDEEGLRPVLACVVCSLEPTAANHPVIQALEALARLTVCVGPQAEVDSQLEFEVVILISLEREQLIHWCKLFNQRTPRPAMLVLSEFADLREEAYNHDADDCFPDLVPELLLGRIFVNVARVRAARGSRSRPPPVRTRSGTLALDLAPVPLFNGTALDLSRVHTRLLRTLLASEEPVSTERLAAAGWPGERVALHTVHTQIALLKTKLEAIDALVTHVRGKGYVLRGSRRE